MTKWTPEDITIALATLAEYAPSKHRDAMADVSKRLGRRVTPDALRNAFVRHGVHPTSILAHCKGREGQTPVERIDQLAEERGYRVESNYTRKLERRLGDRDYLGQRIAESIAAAFDRSPIRVGEHPPPAKPEPCKRLLTTMWSDTHFGVEVRRDEVPGNEYNWTIAARRLAKVCAQLAAWKPDKRDETELRVVINGDVLAGIIHTDDAGIRPLTEQVVGATQILTGAIDYLLEHFEHVSVTCLPGNHDRVTKERQVAQRWNSYAHHVYLAIAQGFRHCYRVTFDVPRTGDAVWQLPGGHALGYATHGDVAPTIRNINKAISTAKPIESLNALNASGEYPLPVRLLLFGHWHTALSLCTQVGTIMVNGCLIGADAFARNGVGIRNGGRPQQWIFESTEHYEVGDARPVDVRDADGDASYDRIIPPPTLEIAA